MSKRKVWVDAAGKTIKRRSLAELDELIEEINNRRGPVWDAELEKIMKEFAA